MPDNRQWEFEDAPRISWGYMATVSVVYLFWLVFLAVMAAQRWWGGLQ